MTPPRLPGLPGLPGRKGFLTAAAAVVAVIVAASAVLLLWPHSQSKQLTAYFTETTGLYTGDRVLVLGVPVGQVDSITPQAGRVKVVLSYASNVRIPAGAQAAIISPTLVTTRSVQLTPVYTSGPVLQDGATIPESRTAVPVEWDQMEQELNTLATALGPHGASAGALNKVLKTSAANLNGQGQNLHDTLTALSQATSTIDNDRGDLFATVDNLQTFVSVLAQANAQVNSFNQQLAAVSGVLASNKQELATTLSTLNSSLGVVEKFVQDNRNTLSTSLGSLNTVTANLARSDQTLANILQVAPTEVANFNNIYDPLTHSITGALAVNNFQDPAEFLCSTIFSVGGTPAQCQQALGPLVNLLGTSNLPVTVDPVNRNLVTAPSTGSKSSGSGSGSGGAGNPVSSVVSGATSGAGGLLNLLLGGGSGS
jgi:phospholipid/cholesterol/gamma-HCH transport system substrate-binding protein